MSEERLPNQISGIGYRVNAYLSIDQWFALDNLLESGFYGSTYKETAEILLIRWLQMQKSGFLADGLNAEDATDKGYYPTIFKRSFPKKPKSKEEEKRLDQPLEIELFSIPAYWVDEMVKKRRHGSNREDIVNKGLEIMLNSPIEIPI